MKKLFFTTNVNQVFIVAIIVLANFLTGHSIHAASKFKLVDHAEKKWANPTEINELFTQLGIVYIDTNIFDSNCLYLINVKKEWIDEPTIAMLPEEKIESFAKLAKNKYRAHVYVKWINNSVGYGVYADQDLRAGDYICEYTGRVYSKLEDPTYTWSYPVGSKWRYVKNRLFYVDAQFFGNEGRFFNDSMDRSKINVVAKSLYTDNQFHLVYIASADIKKDEQLLVSYGDSYWKNKSGEKLK